MKKIDKNWLAILRCWRGVGVMLLNVIPFDYVTVSLEMKCGGMCK